MVDLELAMLEFYGRHKSQDYVAHKRKINEEVKPDWALIDKTDFVWNNRRSIKQQNNYERVPNSLS